MEHGEWDDVPNDEVDGGLRAYAHMRLRSLAYGDYTSDLVAFYLKGLWNRACELFEPEVSNIMPRKLIKQLLPENTAAVYGVLSMRSPGISVIESEHRPFIVIDCGGMTLDGIVGKLDRRIGDRVVFEPISCKTRFAGGVSLEIRFEALVREEIGRLIQRRPDLAIDVALEQLPLVGGRGTITLAGDIITPHHDRWVKVFDETINHIFVLVCQLYDAGQQRCHHGPRRIFLTGGVSCNQLVLGQVQEKLDRHYGPFGIKLEPLKPNSEDEYDQENLQTYWHAVVRGAAAHDIPMFLEPQARP
ncbi:hypothetical protein S7711_10868 [Stachybotrys chartarum IBT 7711]|uniref:Uncharacterized protein n=1 Tax=Stachybotrys chartarum (strain CBS 109288 / IBT 7711) TaxID=1280523 RepID=A0A084B602_STACB|nr:hypothetical protein S7711_10868 [Stachybotrys chartarum IBT 7711]